MGEITRQIVANSDDVLRTLSTDGWDLNASYGVVGRYDADYNQYGTGMRFTNITIGQGVTIITAYLILTAGSSDSGTNVRSRISAEDIDDAITFADNKAAFDTRWAARTTARIDWDTPTLGAWTLNTEYNSPEIKTVIQEIVDRGGWVSGQDIVIFWEDFEERTTDNEAWRQCWHRDGSTAKAPKLYIEYEVVGWTGKISGVTNPAKIMGVEVANIKSVKGVE